MPRYASGNAVKVSTPNGIRDSTGALTDATTISLVVHKPDGTPTTGSPYSPVHDSTGMYHVMVPATDVGTVGMYPYVWQGTVGSDAFTSDSANFDVYDPFEPATLSLQDAKQLLNIDPAITTNDAEITRMIATVQAIIEKAIGGPVITRQFTNERVQCGTGYRTLTVRYRPLVSVVSIADVANGVAISLTDIDVDYNAGVIRRKLQLPFPSWGPYYLITYTAGQGTAVPPGIEQAAGLILQDLWETQRGVGAVPAAATDVASLQGFEFTIPNRRAAELLAPFALEAYV